MLDISIPEEKHMLLIEKGFKILEQIEFSLKIVEEFSFKMCANIINIFDKNLIINELNANTFSDLVFIDKMKNSIEIGVISIIRENGIMGKFISLSELEIITFTESDGCIQNYINQPELTQIIAAINFTMNIQMANIFIHFKYSTKQRIYTLSALGILVNRSLYSIHKLDLLKK